MSLILTFYSKPIIVPRVVNFSKRFITWSDNWLTAKKKLIFFSKDCVSTLFDNLVSFNIPYPDDQKFFKNMALLDFGTICVQEDKFRDTETTTWIGKHVPTSVSISWNLIEQPIFSCKSNPRALIEFFVDALDRLAPQSEAQMKLKFLEVETNVKSKLNQSFFAPN